MALPTDLKFFTNFKEPEKRELTFFLSTPTNRKPFWENLPWHHSPTGRSKEFVCFHPEWECPFCQMFNEIDRALEMREALKGFWTYETLNTIKIWE